LTLKKTNKAEKTFKASDASKKRRISDGTCFSYDRCVRLLGNVKAELISLRSIIRHAVAIEETVKDAGWQSCRSRWLVSAVPPFFQGHEEVRDQEDPKRAAENR
jgi:hypothetical protein